MLLDNDESEAGTVNKNALNLVKSKTQVDASMENSEGVLKLQKFKSFIPQPEDVSMAERQMTMPYDA